MSKKRLVKTFHGFKGRVGVARRDITPPVGIHARNWAASKTDKATGIHRSLTTTALVFADENGGGARVLLGLDLGWWRNIRDAEHLLMRLCSDHSLPRENLVINLAHTHAGPVLSSNATGFPGGELNGPYLETLAEACSGAIGEALCSLRPAVFTWRQGRCNLAAHRDFPDPEDPSRYLCGWNPNETADDTLLVGEACDSEGKRFALLVNYACHPTTLAWGNTLISPDFPGAMRETIEESCPGVLSVFLQGASGELAPAEQYSGEPELADRHGRHLGYAVLACLESGPTAGNELAFDGGVPSGAPLAVWKHRPVREINGDLRSVRVPVYYDVRSDYPKRDDLLAAHRACVDEVEKERLRRKLGVRDIIGDGPTTRQHVWIWKVGDAWIVGQLNEAYSSFQRALRKRFPGSPVVVMNLCNGSCGYLPPRNLYGKTMYSVWQTPFAEGSLERLIELSGEEMGRMIRDHTQSESL